MEILKSIKVTFIVASISNLIVACTQTEDKNKYSEKEITRNLKISSFNGCLEDSIEPGEHESNKIGFDTILINEKFLDIGKSIRIMKCSKNIGVITKVNYDSLEFIIQDDSNVRKYWSGGTDNYGWDNAENEIFIGDKDVYVSIHKGLVFARDSFDIYDILKHTMKNQERSKYKDVKHISVYCQSWNLRTIEILKGLIRNGFESVSIDYLSENKLESIKKEAEDRRMRINKMNSEMDKVLKKK